jgi:hypothetical protein
MKDINSIVAPVRMALGVVAVALAICAIAKMSGLVAVRFGFMELAVVGILCALVSR